MKNKTLFNVIFSILMLFGVANAASFYDSFDFSFGYGVPNDMIIETFVCQDASCTEAVPANVNVYSGDGLTCWNTYSNDLAGFNSCMANYRVNGPLDLSNPSVILEYDTETSFGYVTYFFTEGDEYIVKRVRTTGFNCEYTEACFYDGFDQVTFDKADLGIAEVGQLNVKNIDDPLLPVQIEVPVVIEETVCSAFRFTNSNIYRPVPPVGYSDYSANTLVTLDITNNNDGTNYLSQSITIPIEADSCAGLAPFSWTPSASLEGEEIKFRAETEVVDNQFLSSTPDWAQVIETIYPSDLDNACWTRAYDFTLSNVPDTTMTTSVAQITQGESLYAIFRAGAFRDRGMTPMNFEAIVYFEDNVVSDQLFSTGPAVTEDDLGTYIVDLTNNIAGLPTGQYNVSLITEPVGSGCLVTADVEQTQNLDLLAPQVYDVTFHVRNESGDPVEDADINFNMNYEPGSQTTIEFQTPSQLNMQTMFLYDQSLGVVYQDEEGLEIVSVTGTDASDGVIDELTVTIRSSTEIDLNDLHLFLDNHDENWASAYHFSDLSIEYISNGGVPVSVGKITQGDLVEVTFDNTIPINPLDTLSLDIYSLDLAFSDYYTGFAYYGDSLFTDVNGEGTFNNVYAGNYSYRVHAQGYSQVYNEVIVGDNMDIYVTLLRENVAPVIDLPYEITEYYQNPIEIDIRNYVYDYNDAFYSLDINYYVNGDVNVDVNDGVYTFTTTTPQLAYIEFMVYDDEGESGYDVVRLNFIDNMAPVINTFEATPDNGEAPFNAPFNINISDADGDTLTCVINFGDGVMDTINDCGTLNYLEHSYANPGSYTATLTVSDGINDDVVMQEMIFVYQRTIESPIVNYFRLDSSNGVIVPTDLSLEWDVSHSGNYPMNCTLRVNGVNTPVACIGQTDIFDFNITGISRFHIIAIDNDGTQVVRTIEREFFPEIIRLNSVTTGLIVADEIVPGEFNFEIETTNETLARRDIFIEPMIVCRDIENKLADSKLLDSSAVSRTDDGITSFRFTTDTRDYKLKVPTEENCKFKVILTDGFGSNLELSEDVVFRYLTEETPVASIRGEGTDIVNYIGSTMANPMSNGYNTIEFKAVNNEAIAKELTITMTSAQLGVEYSLELNLGAGQEREVQIPLFIGDNVKPGMYPVRYGVREGSVKQVRYSYIIVE